MKQKTNLFILSLVVTLFSCSQADNKTAIENKKPAEDTTEKSSVNQLDDSTKLKTAWDNFVNAVKTSDFKALRGLSTGCIRSGECVTNTDKEEMEFEKFKNKNPEIWYDKLTLELSFIPIDKFIKEDYPIVFDSTLKLELSNPKNIRIADNEANRKLFTNNCITKDIGIDKPKLKEISVNIEADKKEFDWTASFAFIETKEGYKFCGYSTTP